MHNLETIGNGMGRTLIYAALFAALSIVNNVLA